VPTGPIGPSEKRDLALEHCRGEILAFIDDDAYPVRDWLKNAVSYFENPQVAAVGGPAVTPPADGFMEKASGYVYSSPIVSGQFVYRYIPQEMREVDDYPTCNLLIRKSDFEKIGGFDTKFWPGEDTVACLCLTRDLKKKIVYSPDVLVYHHRRPLFLPHLKQVWSYALHRGYFAKRFPETSLRFAYFLPSLLVFGLIAGLLSSLLNPLIRTVYLATLALYLFLVFATSLKGKGAKMILAVFVGIALTHLCYGIGFLKGLFSRKLKEET
jgi:GT2 family glycosyltransferase